jgi:hypothetical protein
MEEKEMDTYELAKGRMNEFVAEAQRCAMADRYADELRESRPRRRALRFPLGLASVRQLSLLWMRGQAPAVARS